MLLKIMAQAILNHIMTVCLLPISKCKELNLMLNVFGRPLKAKEEDLFIGSPGTNCVLAKIKEGSGLVVLMNIIKYFWLSKIGG